MISLELITPPASEPVTLSEAKAHARVDTNADDALLTALITSARCWVEAEIGYALLPQSWRLWRDDWPELGAVTLPRAPLQSVTSVQIYQADDSATNWSAASYLVDATADPPRLLPRDGQSWPVVGRTARGIAITFTAGYANAATVPAILKQAILLLVASWYEQREVVDPAGVASVPTGVAMLLQPFRRLGV